MSSPITYGIVLGLVAGKPVGIARSRGLAVRLGIGVPPPASTWRASSASAAVAGIGFTVSLFVTGLAFDEIALQDEAKIGILAASIIAALVGSAILSSAKRQ